MITPMLEETTHIRPFFENHLHAAAFVGRFAPAYHWLRPYFCRNDVTGAQMASAMRVHPITRYLYVGTDCYGMWKIAPPARSSSAAR